jgi:hypothetical protein
MVQQLVRKRTLNARRPNQLLMVLNAIRNKKIFSSDMELLNRLPTRIPYNSLKTILTTLEKSNKIIRNRDGSIVWIYSDSLVSRKSLEESVILR